MANCQFLRSNTSSSLMRKYILLNRAAGDEICSKTREIYTCIFLEYAWVDYFRDFCSLACFLGYRNRECNYSNCIGSAMGLSLGRCAFESVAKAFGKKVSRDVPTGRNRRVNFLLASFVPPPPCATFPADPDMRPRRAHAASARRSSARPAVRR
jgi:hypothetical protein